MWHRQQHRVTHGVNNKQANNYNKQINDTVEKRKSIYSVCKRHEEVGNKSAIGANNYNLAD